jgi:hypothetical protein
MSVFKFVSTLTQDEIVQERVASYSAHSETAAAGGWKFYQKFLLRIAVVFFLFMSIPTNAGWYVHLFTMDWTDLHYRDLYDLARFSSGFAWAGNQLFGSNLNGYANWVITFLISVGIAGIWSALVVGIRRDVKNYDLLYYWLRVIVRYRAGIGIIGFGFTKLLPVQMPYPSEGILNTDIGDFTPQKIFWLSIGIVPWYQVFSGVVELAAGALLFFRKTEALGAALLISALGTITYVNFAYDGGVHVYASYFVLYAFFILGYYAPGLYRLLILEKPAEPVDYSPSFSAPWQKLGRVSLKAGVIGVFLVWFFFLQLENFLYDPYKQPAMAGSPELRGLYEVVDFKLNGTSISADPSNPERWNEVTFEKWSTMTYQANQANVLDLSNGGGSPMRDINRTFEIAGVAGGRKAFYFEVDPENGILYLQNKNVSQLRAGSSGSEARQQDVANGANGAKVGEREVDDRLTNAKLYGEDWIPEETKARLGDEIYRISAGAVTTRRIKEIPEEIKRDLPREKMILSYQIFDEGNKVFLSGTNERREPVEIQLRKKARNYLLTRSTLDAGKYDGVE